MGGQNPYIGGPEVPPPSKKYTLIVIDEKEREHRLEVDPAKVPYEDHGLPGSILDICMAHHIELDHACGGVCACSTCHIWVIEGAKSCNEAGEEEEDQLEEAYDLKSTSRLGCQCVPDGSAPVVKVKIPPWNRNLVREPHGPDT